MSENRVSTASQVFRKYGHSLGPESLEFLGELLDRHEIADEEVEFSMEWMAKEYNKQDGELGFMRRRAYLTPPRCPDESLAGCAQQSV